MADRGEYEKYLLAIHPHILKTETIGYCHICSLIYNFSLHSHGF